MPSACCVPNCKSNYTKNSPNISVFSFPKDENTRRAWISAIKRDNFVPTKYSKVCAKHFPENQFLTVREAFNTSTGELIQVPMEYKRLVPGAVPSIFPNLPSYFSSESKARRETPMDRATRKDMENLKAALNSSLQDIAKKEELEKINTFSDLILKFKNFESNIWSVIQKANEIIFICLDTSQAPKVSHSLLISSKLEAHAYVADHEVRSLGNFSFPLVISKSGTIIEILDHLENFMYELKGKIEVKDTVQLICNLLKALSENSEVSSQAINFLMEQVSFLINNKYARRYSSDIMIFSSLLYTIAPSAYKFLRQSGYLVLPHPNTINHLCSKYNVSPQLEQLDSYFLLYIKQKFKYLQEKDKIVTLLLDEVHIKEYFEYKGGCVTGMSCDSEASASSAQVFMVKSIASQYKDVVHVLPVHSISGEILHEFIKKIIIGLEGIGFTVIGIITDNNSVNRKAVGLFIDPPELSYCYSHPVNKQRPLFYVVDPVHLFKCMRNNWLNQKNDGKCFFYPNFDLVPEVKDIANFKTARFSTIRDLYNLESDSLVKYGFKLSLKALAPSNMERQNVQLVLSIFNEHVAEALVELGERKNLIYSKDTSEFLKIIITWWQIVNVKTPNKGKRLNNRYQEPFTFDKKDIKILFLEKFLKWLDNWEDMKFNTGTFTKETRTALVLTTKALIEISSYCKDNFKMSYILPGKLQTDDLESRFDCYRRLAGCQYNISTQQLFECEKKLRIQSLLKLSVPSKSFGTFKITNFETDDIFPDYDPSSSIAFIDLKVEPTDILNLQESLPVLMYLAG
ncbi:uncharacterized protein LOC129959790 [Argiope bruennichi]|uniref:uncharacterized protein LOC129959790 n=1 Tax=Argiope bruennichi TaxID=94029 RepID=UPI002495247E|nr:uncharacterized protein LOC129959790 [Argiope bruennichi]